MQNIELANTSTTSDQGSWVSYQNNLFQYGFLWLLSIKEKSKLAENRS